MITTYELEQELIEWATKEFGRDFDTFSECAGAVHEILSYNRIELLSGTLKEIASFGGEDQGSDFWMVIGFEGEDQFFRFSGHYSSWDGTDWYGSKLEEVVPELVTMTVYNTKK
jgi:hypothetical protein